MLGSRTELIILALVNSDRGLNRINNIHEYLRSGGFIIAHDLIRKTIRELVVKGYILKVRITGVTGMQYEMRLTAAGKNHALFLFG